MVKAAKKGKRQNAKNYTNIESSDDDSVYDFDPKDPFKDDAIERFHGESDKMLLDTLSKKKKKPYDISSDEEEVLAFDDDDDDEDDLEESDARSELSEDDENEEKADDINENELDEEDLLSGGWGSRKSAYYSGNKIQNVEDADLEEEAAKLMQAKMMKQLDMNDFDLDSFKKTTKQQKQDEAAKNKDLDEQFDVEKILSDLSNMSTKDKLNFLRQESPELFELVKEFKEKVKEIEEVLIPIYNLIREDKLPRSPANDYVFNKLKLYLMYCCHLGFYFSLKSERIPIDNHPIIKNILQYRHLCKQLNGLDEQLKDEIDFLLKSIKDGNEIKVAKQNLIKKKRVKFNNIKPIQRNEFKYDDDNDKMQEDSTGEFDDSTQNEQNPQQDIMKRPINYTIEKNKGLTPKRNKLQRNPRVKHREKFRKALIKRKSVVPRVRKEESRYSGEKTGIRVGVVRGIKIK